MSKHDDISLGALHVPGASIQQLEKSASPMHWRTWVRDLSMAVRDANGDTRPRAGWQALVKQAWEKAGYMPGLMESKQMLAGKRGSEHFANQLADLLRLDSHSPLRRQLVDAGRQSQPETRMSFSEQRREERLRRGVARHEAAQMEADAGEFDIDDFRSPAERASLAESFDMPHAPADEGQSRRIAREESWAAAEDNGRGKTRSPYAEVFRIAQLARGGNGRV